MTYDLYCDLSCRYDKYAKAKRDPADGKLKKLSSSMYMIVVVKPEENKVRVYGVGKNYTGYVTVRVTD